MDSPANWHELTSVQQGMVERYIQTLLLQQAPLLIEKKGREVIKQKIYGSVSYQLERVRCGKDCKGCPHGPYWYAYYRKDGRVVSKYVGKEFKRLD